MEIKIDIIDYMGKLEDGVIVLLSVNCDDVFSEGTIFYSDTQLSLTVDSVVEDAIGCEIEKWEGYESLLKNILDKLIPCSEISPRLDEIDFSKYVSVNTDTIIVDEIDSSLVGTQSNL